MWQVFEKIYEIFQDKGIEYFTDMMPALHNYITKDTETFLSNEIYVVAIFNMCKAVRYFTMNSFMAARYI